MAGKTPLDKKKVSTVAKVAGRSMVFGLTWQVSDQVRLSYSHVRREAVKVGSDLFLTHKAEKRAQYAFASTKTGAKRGCISAATVAAAWLPTDTGSTAKNANWCGVFTVGGGYWVIGVDKGLVVPSGDRWFVDLNDALMALEDLRREHAFHTALVDDHIALPVDGTNVARLDAILKGKGAKLQSTRDLFNLGAVAGIAIAAGIGALLYLDYEQKVELEQQAERLRMEQQQRAASDAARRASLQPPPDPWLMLVHPMKIASDCGRAMAPMTVAPAGWQVTSLNCASGMVVGVSWRRLPSGLPETLVDGAREVGIARISYASESGNEASASLPVQSTSPAFAASAASLSFLDANLALREAARRVSGRLAIREDRGVPLPQIPDNQTHGKDAIEKSRAFISFTLNTPLPPEALAPIIFLPGMVFKDIQFATSTGNNSIGSITWTVTGNMYVVR